MYNWEEKSQSIKQKNTEMIWQISESYVDPSSCSFYHQYFYIEQEKLKDGD